VKKGTVVSVEEGRTGGDPPLRDASTSSPPDAAIAAALDRALEPLEQLRQDEFQSRSLRPEQPTEVVLLPFDTNPRSPRRRRWRRRIRRFLSAHQAQIITYVLAAMSALVIAWLASLITR
jgi:hypothetical protein